MKILITGFPHSGTTILKSIIGHIPHIKETIGEQKKCKENGVCKFIYRDTFKTDLYIDYHRILIIRNPIFIFSSLNRRFNYKIPKNHSLQLYVKILENYYSNIFYTIKYEDLFPNDYKKLRNLLTDIGLTYNDTIFDNELYYNLKNRKTILKGEIPKEIDHNEFRMYQINQPFINNNLIDKIDLLEEQITFIKTNKLINTIYPEIKDILLEYDDRYKRN